MKCRVAGRLGAQRDGAAGEGGLTAPGGGRRAGRRQRGAQERGLAQKWNAYQDKFASETASLLQGSPVDWAVARCDKQVMRPPFRSEPNGGTVKQK